MTDPDFIPNPTPVPSYPALPQWPDVVAHVLRTDRRVAAILHEAIPQSAADGKAIIEFKSPIHVTIASQSTAIADALTHVLGGTWEVRCVLMKPRDEESNVLFAPQTNPPTRTERRPTPRPRRWRDEDMPLRPGDVIAVGLRHHNCVVGQVAAVNDQCFRLNQYNRGGDTFNTGVAVVAWSQVEEFGPVARKRGAAWLMQELVAFQTAWTEGKR